MNKVMIIGASGSMASYLLEGMTKDTLLEPTKFFMVGRDALKLSKAANILTIASDLYGSNHQFLPLVIDVESQQDLLSESIRINNPDIVVNATRALTGVKYGPMSMKMDVGYGVWLPFSIRLSYLIAKAVKCSGRTPYLVNSSYSDAVCPALSQMEDAFTPTTGIGNVFHLVPRIKMAVCEIVNQKNLFKEISPADLEVFLTSGHFSNTYISREGDARGSETLLEVYKTTGKFEDILYTHGITKEEIYKKCKDIKVAEGPQRNLMAASSTARCIKELLDPTGTTFHAPGVQGLVGGYPVRALLDELTGKVNFNIYSPKSSIMQMIDCNKQNLACDGIQSIEGGVVTWTESSRESLKEHVGFDLSPMNLDFSTISEYGDELKSKLLEKGLMK